MKNLQRKDKYIITTNMMWNKYAILIIFFCLLDTSIEYQKMHVEDDNLCSLTREGKIILQKEEQSGLIISLGNITALKEQKEKWDDDFICEFQVLPTKQDTGIFAIIQNIQFRKDNETGECIDYVQYRNFDGIPISKKYCDQTETDYQFLSDASDLAINSFAENNVNSLHVYIKIPSVPLRPHEDLKLEIVFTSFGSCFQNVSYFDEGGWCWNGSQSYCISKKFFKDGYLNCPHYKCSDETGCGRSPNGTSLSQLLIFGIIVLCLSATLIIVSICMYFIYWKYKEKWLNDTSIHNTNAHPYTIRNRYVARYVRRDSTSSKESIELSVREASSPSTHL